MAGSGIATQASNVTTVAATPNVQEMPSFAALLAVLLASESVDLS
jgi:hypothetical protein